LRGVSEELAMASRLIAHWLAFAPLLLLATLPAAALLGLSGATVRTLLLGLLAGTPGLAAIGLAIAALTASLRGGAALAGLMVIPLALPVLIFGAGALARPDDAALALTAAISLGLCALAPIVAGAAIRAARES
jgi:heme exporter protein B